MLPSGRTVRGRGLRHGPPAVPADVSVVLHGQAPRDERWWVRWPDWRLPAEPAAAGAVLREALDRAGSGRVEVCCSGGVGRTGTALAWWAVLDGVPAAEAVSWVRTRYHPRAVETPWQRRFVARLDR